MLRLSRRRRRQNRSCKRDQKARQKNVEFVLPVDTVIAKEIAAGSESKVVDLEEGVPAGWKGLDIGPSTIDLLIRN